MHCQSNVTRFAFWDHCGFKADLENLFTRTSLTQSWCRIDFRSVLFIISCFIIFSIQIEIAGSHQPPRIWIEFQITTRTVRTVRTVHTARFSLASHHDRRIRFSSALALIWWIPDTRPLSFAGFSLGTVMPSLLLGRFTIELNLAIPREVPLIHVSVKKKKRKCSFITHPAVI